ncbi:hypothetical protein PR202_gb04582 [Eleusine coracana subsp. coracana]|uniref:Uncharacterized protein n=1 Tax=Eleusine coracana subsp. coracana TaxID=191504 RepID=A0AAV5E4X1_ELECO|nr:hypothetical protein PR202_gb04582 [Eleusine coracana subsp. coracana]
MKECLGIFTNGCFSHSLWKENPKSGTRQHLEKQKVQNRILNIAYNVVNGLCTPIPDQSALVYITIGDGGNQEGLATK